MSMLARLLTWLGQFRPAARHTPHPDCMTLHDWADLPAHHPGCDH